MQCKGQRRIDGRGGEALLGCCVGFDITLLFEIRGKIFRPNTLSHSKPEVPIGNLKYNAV